MYTYRLHTSFPTAPPSPPPTLSFRPGARQSPLHPKNLKLAETSARATVRKKKITMKLGNPWVCSCSWLNVAVEFWKKC